MNMRPLRASSITSSIGESALAAGSDDVKTMDQ
jgi:hypothetical protein